MKNASIVVVLFVLAALASGCAGAASPIGPFGYMDVTYAGESAPDGKLGPKRGVACGESILGLVTTGDMSLAAAAAAGGIKVITAVDRSSKGVFGFYAQHCTIVYGN